MTTLIVARHGNTFGPNDTPTRVGARTDLPLVDSGRRQAERLGDYLLANDLQPDRVFTSTLQRTRMMATIALARCNLACDCEPRSTFDEIDYGPDENLPESDVVARIGQAAIDAWNERAEVPPGWQVDPMEVISNWQRFADELISLEPRVVLVVTSNGIARFAPHLTGDFEGFLARFDLKLSTGAVGI
ncbi:MAG: histidine phosphatase family protein, partial [Pseudomonadota bacterium]